MKLDITKCFYKMTVLRENNPVDYITTILPRDFDDFNTTKKSQLGKLVHRTIELLREKTNQNISFIYLKDNTKG